MNRRDFLHLLAGVSAATLLSGCVGSRSKIAYHTFDEDEGIHCLGGWQSRTCPAPAVESLPRNEVTFAAPKPEPVAPAPVIESHVPAQQQGLVAINRSSWGATPARTRKLRPMGDIKKITIHHEGNPRPNWDIKPVDVAKSLRQIQAGHFKRLGAGDIGYHFIIDRVGRIWQGRDLRYQGAHTKKHNRNNVGIMCLGNFELQQPGSAQVESLSRLVARLMSGYCLTINDIYGHRELRSTACPGKHLFAEIKKLRIQLA